MILLDTNVLSELMKTHASEAVMTWANKQPRNTLFISAITYAEIELGIALLAEGKRRQKIRKGADLMFDAFSDRTLIFDTVAAIKYSQLVAHRTRSGQPISVEDAQIASIALAHELHVATRNIRDFKNIPNLTLINPWQDLSF